MLLGSKRSRCMVLWTSIWPLTKLLFLHPQHKALPNLWLIWPLFTTLHIAHPGTNRTYSDCGGWVAWVPYTAQQKTMWETCHRYHTHLHQTINQWTTTHHRGWVHHHRGCHIASTGTTSHNQKWPHCHQMPPHNNLNTSADDAGHQCTEHLTNTAPIPPTPISKTKPWPT